jgi:deoxyribonuclease V
VRPDPENRHPWNLAPREAIALQRELAGRIQEKPLPADIATVAGLDVSIRADRARAAVVVMALESLQVVEFAVWEGPVVFPYVPGLLSFREMPAVIPALERLTAAPDVLMADAQGYAHPRRFGLACHLGLYYDAPALGVAKTRLVGAFQEPANERGATADLMDDGEVIGRAVRTRVGVKPVFVSVGHRIRLDDAVDLTLRCTTRYKIPEPTRLAHRLSKSGRL